MTNIPEAACPQCAWSSAPHSCEPDEIVKAGVALEEHLARDHETSWSRAREVAGQWLTRAIASLPKPS